MAFDLKRVIECSVSTQERTELFVPVAFPHAAAPPLG
jgi:hypothetical protein